MSPLWSIAKRDAVQAQVATQQPAVDVLVVLVGVAADERVHRDRVVADDQLARRRELALAGQVEDEDPGRRLLRLDLRLGQRAAGSSRATASRRPIVGAGSVTGPQPAPRGG